MSLIYEPKGKAREYSPLALNIFKGCDNGCFYCYVPVMNKQFQTDYKHNIVEIRKDLLKNLEKEAEKHYNTNKQVLLSFSTDPYCQFDVKENITSKVLEILYMNKIPVAILSKGGSRMLRDIDIFKKFGDNIKIGTSLTFDNDLHTEQYEKGSASYTDRIATMKILKDEGIKTWVSIEPVLNHQQSLSCIEKSIPYSDHYKVGKINYYPEIEYKINWSNFYSDAVRLLRDNNMKFYIKKDLRKFNDNIYLYDNEIDFDFLNVKNSYDKP